MSDPQPQAPSRLLDGRIETHGTLYSLQLLRFIAAAFVVLSHVRLEFKLEAFGYFGVDIFFAISGFIIYHVTRGNTKHFLTKRLIRIVPLYWTGTLALTAIALLAPHILNNGQTASAARIFTSLFFIPYWTAAHDFQPLLSFGWTLNYEMLFYFLFYVAMLVSHRHRFLVCSSFLSALAISQWVAIPNSAHAFWSGTIIIEFIYGMGIAVLVERTRFLSLARTPLLLAAAAMGMYCYLLFPSTGFLDADSVRVVMIGIPSMLLVLLILSCELSIRKLPARVTRSISFLGDLSFATYIFHAYVMALLKRVIGQDMNIYSYAVIVLVCTSLVAMAIFFMVEKPSRTYLTSRLAGRTPVSLQPHPVPVAPG